MARLHFWALGADSWPEHEPHAALSIHCPESSLQAAATAAAPPPLPADQAQAARQRAATAATTLPPSARLFGPLPPPHAPPASKISPSKQAALDGAKKQLDERWAAEQEELQPRLEHLWPPPWQRSAPQPLPLPPLAVPLPDGRKLAADFLGLRL